MTTQANQCGWGLIINIDVGPTFEERYMHVNFKLQRLWYIWLGVGQN